MTTIDLDPATDFDPEARLPGAPDPWASTSTPSPRSGPPYHMTDMIAAEPALAERVLGRLAGPEGGAARLAALIREVAHFGEPIVVTGCGTIRARAHWASRTSCRGDA